MGRDAALTAPPATRRTQCYITGGRGWAVIFKFPTNLVLPKRPNIGSRQVSKDHIMKYFQALSDQIS